MQTIKVSDSVGTVLCHDITRIVPEEFKGPAFKKGHIITADDIPELLKLGKEHIYVWELQSGKLRWTSALLMAAIALAAVGGGAGWGKQRQDAAALATAGGAATGPNAARRPGGGPGRFGGGNVQPVSVGTVQRGDVRVVVSAIGTMSARATATRCFWPPLIISGYLWA